MSNPIGEDGSAAAMTFLQEQLQRGLASGKIRPDRSASYARLLDKMAGLMTQMSDSSTALSDKVMLLERFRGLMGDFQDAFVNPGAGDRLDHLPAESRARALEYRIGEMKGFLYRELAQTPEGHTAERAAELIADLMRAHAEVDKLADDEAATSLELEFLRATAQGVHDFSIREHLMLARPLWECGEVMASPRGLFYSGDADLAATAQSVAARLRLKIPVVHGQYYGQARWDALRSSHVGVFDLRGYRPGLVETDPAAATALAGTAYELGLACALGKPVVIVTLPDANLPFDIDITPCESPDGAGLSELALADAIDNAFYGRQRTTSSSSLSHTFRYLERITQDHPRRRMLEITGLLGDHHIADPVGFAGSVKQVLREDGLDDLQTLLPAWPGRYPDDAVPTVFHVMPFSEEWSNEVRDIARAAAGRQGYTYRRGDEADEGRIIQSIWDDICAAHVVLVDLTGLNLNVLMELGMAHALGRSVVMVRQSAALAPLPRNIQKLRVLDYASVRALARLLERRSVGRSA